jgi:hypothetical protein
MRAGTFVRFFRPDIARQADAQAVLRADPADPYRLDADEVGVDCDRNRPPTKMVLVIC